MRKNVNRKKNKPEITIMTLLACECPKEATDLLLKNGGKRAKDYKDLERKLGEMYVKSDDKAGLEKEMAAIHPHKKWLDRVIEPKIKSIKVEPDPEGVETKVDPKLIERIHNLEQRTSNFFGVEKATPETPKEEKTSKESTTQLVFGLVTVVAVLGIVVIAKKNI